MNLLLLGADLKAKDLKVAQVKSSLFKHPQALNFDFENLDADHLPADILKKALITLPVMSAKRLVLLHNTHKLKSSDIESLIAFLRSKSQTTDVILESSQMDFKGDLKGIVPLCQVIVLDTGEKNSAFDIGHLMTAGKTKDALIFLNGCYAQGQHPLLVMGALVWIWGKEGRRLKQEYFEQGLKALEEADVNIKRSRLLPEYAVEKVVVELTALLSRR